MSAYKAYTSAYIQRQISNTHSIFLHVSRLLHESIDSDVAKILSVIKSTLKSSINTNKICTWILPIKSSRTPEIVLRLWSVNNGSARQETVTVRTAPLAD